MNERRQIVRWPISEPVKYKIKEADGEYQCKCLDLGPKGIGLELDEDISTDTLLKLNISLNEQGCVGAVGRIAWKNQLDDGSGKVRAGLQFVHVVDSDKEKIFRYMISNHRDKFVQHWWEGLTESVAK